MQSGPAPIPHAYPINPLAMQQNIDLNSIMSNKGSANSPSNEAGRAKGMPVNFDMASSAPAPLMQQHVTLDSQNTVTMPASVNSGIASMKPQSTDIHSGFQATFPNVHSLNSFTSNTAAA